MHHPAVGVTLRQQLWIEPIQLIELIELIELGPLSQLAGGIYPSMQGAGPGAVASSMGFSRLTGSGLGLGLGL